MSDTDKNEKTDKTSDKLVASIRKTRAGAAKKTTARKATTSGTAASAGKQPAASTRRAGKAEKKVPQAPVSTDAYQYGRRIWPD